MLLCGINWCNVLLKKEECGWLRSPCHTGKLNQHQLFYIYHQLVRRRHKHVGAPDNRIKSLWIENVLTPQGKDMILELGPMVTVPP